MLQSLIYSLILALFLFLPSSGLAETEQTENAHAATEEEEKNSAPRHVQASAFLLEVTQRGITELTLKDMTENEREERFRSFLADHFDIGTIGRFVLGPAWRRATAEQQTRYLTLFEEFIIATYAHRLSQYDGEELTITGSRDIANSPDSRVFSKVAGADNTEPVTVEWRIRRDSSGIFKIVDIEIGGVSMSLTQRSDFASVIRQGGGRIEALLVHLEHQTRKKEQDVQKPDEEDTAIE